MPRKIRLLSEANIYHIVLKSINSEKIFFDDDDYLTFLKVLKSSCNDYDVQVIAYCLMNNHIHLLMKFSDTNMAPVFKSLGASFVLRYNNKYMRTGSLFNGRYYSKAVNNDEYLLTVLKYIHYNPINAGLCALPDEYKWSSYNEYIRETDTFCKTGFIYGIIDKNQFLELHKREFNDIYSFLPIENGIEKLSYLQLKSIVNDMKKHFSIFDIAKCLNNSGVPAYKIAKLLDISRSSAYKLKNI